MLDSADANDLRHVLAVELRHLQVQSGRSLRELARCTASSDSALSRYLSGRVVPPWPVAEALCRAGQGDLDALRTMWDQARSARIKDMNRSMATTVPGGALPLPKPVAASEHTNSEAAAAGQPTEVPTRGDNVDTTTADPPIGRDQASRPSPAVPDRLPSARPEPAWSADQASAAAPDWTGVPSPAPSWTAHPRSRTRRTLVIVSALMAVAGLIVGTTVLYSELHPGPSRPAPPPTVTGREEPRSAPRGAVQEVTPEASGWHVGDTGHTGTALSVVDMGSAHPRAMVVRDGQLHHVYADDAGWHDAATGIDATAVTAVNMGDGWPRAMILGPDRHIREVYGNANGWRAYDTGIAATTISAVYLGGSHPQVVATDGDDRVFYISGDNTGWHAVDTGLRARTVSAVDVQRGPPQIIAVDRRGHVLQFYRDVAGWHSGDTALLARTVSAVYLGGIWPQIMALDDNNRLLRCYGDSTGWHAVDTGITATAVSALPSDGNRPRAMVLA